MKSIVARATLGVVLSCATVFSSCSSGESEPKSPGPSDAGADSADGAVCAFTLEQFCTPAQACITDWTHAQNLAGWCTVKTPYQLAVGECAGYEEITLIGSDTEDDWFYSASTGQLVAVLHSNGAGFSCVAGPPGFSAPECHKDASVDGISVCADASGD